MSLLIAFENAKDKGNNFLLDYLSAEFPTVSIDGKKVKEGIENNPGGKCLFTTDPFIAQEAAIFLPSILYINDPNEGYSSRGDNVSNWRQNLSAFKRLDSIFVASSALATTFLNTYRIPCKVQYPYVPPKEKSNPLYILYNRYPIFADEMQNFAPNESYAEFSEYDDFQNAKLYVHTPEAGEQWSVNVLMAHTYGVPCITYQQGCFSEFCTAGDKILPVGVDVKTWMGNFKLAMRDRSINSKIVYEMSKRFHSMDELKQRIKKALSDNGMKTMPPTFAEVQTRASGVDSLKRLQGRKIPTQSSATHVQKIVRPPSRRHDYSGLYGFLNDNAAVYAGVGGLGDAIITIAAAMKEPGSKVIYGANSGVREPVKQLFDTFGIDVQLVQNFNGSVEGLQTWNSILDHPHCRGSVHIPRDLNYGEWLSNPQKFLDRIPKRMPLIETNGKLVNPRATKKVIGLCPRGGDHTSTWKQRYLSRDEYQKLVQKLLLEDATVMVFGSSEDLSYYGIYQNNNVMFMNSNFGVSYPAPKYPITMRHLLSAINSCDLVISMDTWFKTYAGLAGIPCKVIMNRYFGKSTLEYADGSDKIFLDVNFWGFEVVPIETLF